MKKHKAFMCFLDPYSCQTKHSLKSSNHLLPNTKHRLLKELPCTVSHPDYTFGYSSYYLVKKVNMAKGGIRCDLIFFCFLVFDNRLKIGQKSICLFTGFSFFAEIAMHSITFVSPAGEQFLQTSI